MIMTSGGAQGFLGLGEREVGNAGNFQGELGSKLIFWGCREPCRKVKKKSEGKTFDPFASEGLFSPYPPCKDVNVFICIWIDIGERR